ncbi:hypothetical protein NDU88_002217 [Pleurodeles waltl]|uniref:Uncharacterized protein n=1 Tax=Pleurodeles waltl TaxID=8319 RepID=A0AAV7WRP5_PLEWA|nr:hypothetical protein NDU88_002217 [Pleurodeles waltl]
MRADSPLMRKSKGVYVKEDLRVGCLEQENEVVFGECLGKEVMKTSGLGGSDEVQGDGRNDREPLELVVTLYFMYWKSGGIVGKAGT